MTPEIRSAEVRRLLRAAADKPADLGVLSALDLCVLEGCGTALCDEYAARAWMAISESARADLTAFVADSLRQRHLVQAPDAPDAPVGTGNPATAADPRYPLSPQLALILAARARPAWAALTRVDGGDQHLPTPKAFGLGDSQVPVRAVIVEIPVALSGRRSRSRQQAGPLAWLYRYRLADIATGLRELAEWAMPAAEHDARQTRLIAVYSHRPERPLRRVSVAVSGSQVPARFTVQGDPNVHSGDAEALAAELRRVCEGAIT
jgi:signal transduction histidine kinase